MIHHQIEQKLTEAFQPTYLKVINESNQHRVPSGSETHFKVIIVSDSFLQQRHLARHRMLYQILAAELANGVHALALHVYTPQEWAKQEKVPDSPPCRGAGI